MSDLARTTRRLGRGATAGLVATLTMSGAMAIAKATGLLGEPPPKKLVRRLLSVVGLRPERERTLHLVTTAAHAAFGAANGALFALLPRRARSPVSGAAFGLLVWGLSYAGWIPKLRLMAPPQRDRPGRPTAMVLAHLVYGATLGESLSA